MASKTRGVKTKGKGKEKYGKWLRPRALKATWTNNRKFTSLSRVSKAILSMSRCQKINCTQLYLALRYEHRLWYTITSDIVADF